MSDSEIRKAIAEKCGWDNLALRISKGLAILLRVPIGDPTVYPKPSEANVLDYLGVPDYPNDLNAMHEAEKTLDERNLSIMGKILWEINSTHVWHATDRQRAEAFLRAFGLWKES